MSKNNKNARKIKEARERKGVKGPAKTTTLHKKKAWYRTGNNNNPKKTRGGVDKQAQTE